MDVSIPDAISGRVDMKRAFERVIRGQGLSRDQARQVFDAIMAGEVDERAVAALLGALAAKGESVAEITGAAEAMRAKAIAVRCDRECIDTCGTGGDGVPTFNVSTCAAIIAAAAGAVVAKHGNRSTSRPSGSTDVLFELGIDVEADRATVEACLREVGIGYLNARRLHPAMRFAAPVRAALPMRTIFNLLGPLTNPAGVRRQLVGVPRPELAGVIAESLAELGVVHAWVVHGGGGLCDLSVVGESMVVEVTSAGIRQMVVRAEDVGLNIAPLQTLLVQDARESAQVVLGILSGTRGPARDHTLLNAGAALVIAGRAEDLSTGVALARQAIENGAALDTLHRWRTMCPRSTRTGNGDDPLPV